MRIQVTEVEGPITLTGKNNRPYKMVTIKYLSNGKVYEKKLTQFSDAYMLLSAAMPDQLFTVDLVKDGQYTEWKNVIPFEDTEVYPQVTSEPEVQEVKKGRPKGSPNKVQSATSINDPRETPEERKARQELIVRQSSISNAIDFFTLRNQGLSEGIACVVDVGHILEIAQKFRDFVYTNPDRYDSQSSLDSQ